VSLRHGRLWLWLTLGGGAFVIVALFAIASWVPFSSETLRAKVVATLADRLDAEVELQDLHIRVLPRFRAEGTGLTIRHKRRHDVPPLISVKTFSVDADLIGLLRRHVARVTLNGLDIEIPPHGNDDDGAGRAEEAGPPPRAGEAGTAKAARSPRGRLRRPGDDVIVDHLLANEAQLVIIPLDPNRVPRVWAIHALHMRTVGFDRAMPFDATLTNGIPPGEIATQGIFGPWQAENPGATPVDGTFTFARADLGVFTGISGMLSAHGEFGGTLGRLGIHGETDTPDFTLAISGHPVPLHTDYHATVDGTNGDTLLDRIDAKLLNTSFVAKGGVIGGPGQEGRTIKLDIVMEKARLEDIMRLAVKASKSPMSGGLTLTTTFVLPPGERDVVDKLRLDGRFAIATARFSNINIQKRVNEFSQRSRGNQASDDEPSVASNFKGQFRLADGTLSLQGLAFDIPGASVRLAGTYALRSELLDFTGMLLMDAKISETQTGLKRLLLKMIDPLFKKDGGGSAIPIKIVGKRSDPSFGLDKSRVFHRGR
jgi:hypothetical protein